MENILISNDERSIKIIDYGLAARKPPSGDFLLQGRTGKPGYMAPEIYKGQPFNPLVADVWSAGMTVFLAYLNCKL